MLWYLAEVATREFRHKPAQLRPCQLAQCVPAGLQLSAYIAVFLDYCNTVSSLENIVIIIIAVIAVDHHKVVWFIILISSVCLSVCMSVCLSVCLSDDNFQKP